MVLLTITCIIYAITSWFEVMFLREWTLGIKPVVFFGVISLFDAAAIQAFFGMPLLATFAKLMPTSIETSMFALMTGLINLSFHFLSKMVGNVYNALFFKVDKENLEDLWKCFLLQTFCSLLPLAFLWILPNREEVEEVQKRIKEEEEQQNGETKDEKDEIELQKVTEGDRSVNAIQ